jgi:hypothetical protein
MLSRKKARTSLHYDQTMLKVLLLIEKNTLMEKNVKSVPE